MIDRIVDGNSAAVLYCQCRKPHLGLSQVVTHNCPTALFLMQFKLTKHDITWMLLSLYQLQPLSAMLDHTLI
jgi:hypothetical protein